MSGIATIVGTVLLAFPLMGVAEAPDYTDYTGSESCIRCHEENFALWSVSGHPYKLMRAEEAKNRPIPLPEGVLWEDVTYVIGGYKWKSRYIDNEGFIYTPDDGQNQYNNLTGTWSDYHAGEVKPYDCGTCHTTAWIPDTDADTDGDLTDNQDELPGMLGTFAFGGIHCEECHGPGDNFDTGMQIDLSRPEEGGPIEDMDGAFCGRCHVRYDGNIMPPADENYIPASDGFIRHHEQYNEFLAGAHGSFGDIYGVECIRCHNPHEKSEWSIWEEGEYQGDNFPVLEGGAQCGVDCHASKMESYSKTTMYDYGVTCEDCHMPFATKSAQKMGVNQDQGDVMTHLFRINTDPTANMFTEDGGRVLLNDDGEGAVTMNFACQRCHTTATLEELAKYADGFHDSDDDLTGFDPGLSGTWYGGETRDGEGFVLDFTTANGAPYLFGSFYTYDDMGNQVYLVALSTSVDGTTTTVNVYITQGRMWGADFDPTDGATVLWGTGTFTFPSCSAGSFTLVPGADAMAAGFTELTYSLTRLPDLEPGIVCPTFVNNAN
jgi:hypothetical protein